MASHQRQQDYGFLTWLAILLPLYCTGAILGNGTVTDVNHLSPAADVYQNRVKKIKQLNKTAVKSLESKNLNSTIPNALQQNLTFDAELQTIASKVHRFGTSYKNNSQFPFYKRIRTTLTQSKDAIWATITLTFMCIILLLAVAQSKMWKDYHGSEAQGIPLPNFNERVPFREVMERKVATLRELIAKGKKKKSTQPNETELESLLDNSEFG